MFLKLEIYKFLQKILKDLSAYHCEKLASTLGLDFADFYFIFLVFGEDGLFRAIQSTTRCTSCLYQVISVSFLFYLFGLRVRSVIVD